MQDPEDRERTASMINDLNMVGEIVANACKDDAEPFGAKATARLYLAVGLLLGENEALCGRR